MTTRASAGRATSSVGRCPAPDGICQATDGRKNHERLKKQGGAFCFSLVSNLQTSFNGAAGRCIEARKSALKG
jgi:hypothetical protein